VVGCFGGYAYSYILSYFQVTYSLATITLQLPCKMLTNSRGNTNMISLKHKNFTTYFAGYSQIQEAYEYKHD
jgi:hypothetical protein